MGAVHFLDNTGAGHLRLAGREPETGPHCLELYETGSELFLRLTLDGRNPGGGLRTITLPLSHDDARALRDGASEMLARVGQS